jgi:hypothetical protein
LETEPNDLSGLAAASFMPVEAELARAARPRALAPAMALLRLLPPRLS